MVYEILLELTEEIVTEISGSISICVGSSTTLCATQGYEYLWSTNESTECITVSGADMYSVEIMLGECMTVESFDVTLGANLKDA